MIDGDGDHVRALAWFQGADLRGHTERAGPAERAHRHKLLWRDRPVVERERESHLIPETQRLIAGQGIGPETHPKPGRQIAWQRCSPDPEMVVAPGAECQRNPMLFQELEIGPSQVDRVDCHQPLREQAESSQERGRAFAEDPVRWGMPTCCRQQVAGDRPETQPDVCDLFWRFGQVDRRRDVGAAQEVGAPVEQGLGQTVRRVRRKTHRQQAAARFERQRPDGFLSGAEPACGLFRVQPQDLLEHDAAQPQSLEGAKARTGRSDVGHAGDPAPQQGLRPIH